MGQRVFPTVTVRVVRSDGSGVGNVSVSVSAVPQGQDSRADIIGVTNTSLDQSGLPVGNSFSVPGLIPKVYQTPLLSGNTGLSDSDGYVRFRSLVFEVAIPSTYLLYFSSPGANVSQTAFTSITLTRNVDSLTVSYGAVSVSVSVFVSVSVSACLRVYLCLFDIYEPLFE